MAYTPPKFYWTHKSIPQIYVLADELGVAPTEAPYADISVFMMLCVPDVATKAASSIHSMFWILTYLGHILGSLYCSTTSLPSYWSSCICIHNRSAPYHLIDKTLPLILTPNLTIQKTWYAVIATQISADGAFTQAIAQTPAPTQLQQASKLHFRQRCVQVQPLDFFLAWLSCSIQHSSLINSPRQNHT